MGQLVIGDLHLDGSWDGINRTEDIFSFLENLYNYYMDAHSTHEQITSIIWLGDIFDSPNASHSCISRFIKYLDKWKFVNHYILKGNHDGEIGTKKGSPLEEIEAAGSATVIWEPTFIKDIGMMIPYTTQDKLDCLEPKYDRVFTHVDIVGVTPGIEKEIGRGLPCVLPAKFLETGCRIFAGHIHKPQILNNLIVVGSVIKINISEQPDQKVYYLIQKDSLGTDVIHTVQIPCRSIKSFKIDYGTTEGKLLYSELQSGKHIELSDLVSVELLCPHTEAHTVDILKFQDSVKPKCNHLRFDFKILKERVLRIKDLGVNQSDLEIVSKYLDSQNISSKDSILESVKAIVSYAT